MRENGIIDNLGSRIDGHNTGYAKFIELFDAKYRLDKFEENLKVGKQSLKKTKMDDNQSFNKPKIYSDYNDNLNVRSKPLKRTKINVEPVVQPILPDEISKVNNASPIITRAVRRKLDNEEMNAKRQPPISAFDPSKVDDYYPPLPNEITKEEPSTTTCISVISKLL